VSKITKVIFELTELEKAVIPESLSKIIDPRRIEEIINRWKKNPMTIPYIAKVTVNMSIGEGGEKLMRAMKLLEQITGAKPVPRRAKRTIREFNVRRGENIATIVTLRGEMADSFLRRIFQGIGGRINETAFDPYGNVSLGVKEHLVIPGTRYDPEIGIFGMDIAITFEKKGYRVAKRRRKRSRIPRRHRVSKEEAMILLTLKYNISIIPSSK